jgi:topoisomerase-4 subunit A
MQLLEKFKPGKTYTAIHFDGEQGQYYLKRFEINTDDKETLLISEHPKSALTDLVFDRKPVLQVIFGGVDAPKTPETIDCDEFIAIKGATARGKRITTNEIAKFIWLDPIPVDEEIELIEDDDEAIENEKSSPIQYTDDDDSQMTLNI